MPLEYIPKTPPFSEAYALSNWDINGMRLGETHYGILPHLRLLKPRRHHHLASSLQAIIA